MYYNSKLDPSNTLPQIKLLEDSMKKRKIIVDDIKQYCRGISIEPDESLDKNEYKILIFGERK